MATKTYVLTDYAKKPLPLMPRATIIADILRGRADYCRARIRALRFTAAKLDLMQEEDGARVYGMLRSIDSMIAHWDAQYKMAKDGIGRRAH